MNHNQLSQTLLNELKILMMWLAENLKIQMSQNEFFCLLVYTTLVKLK